MAERRMFAKTIIDSDAFLDMPLSAQALYFHLSMRADDDGFINNPKKIQRMVGASDDDCKLLLMKRFLIAFESGVVVIKHWKIHNYIRNDRYKPTIYQEEMRLLAEKENKAYTDCQPLGIPNGYQMDTQDRLGKDRTVKDSIVEGIIVDSDESKTTPKIDYQSIMDMFNTICVSLPSVRSLSAARKKAIKARLNTYTVEDFKQCFENAEASSFLKGGNNRNWTANFDWLINDTNMAKVLDGNYADKPSKGTALGSSFDVDDFFEAALAKSWANKEQPKTAADDPEIRDKGNALKERLGIG
jgi:hypothetical protein